MIELLVLGVLAAVAVIVFYPTMSVIFYVHPPDQFCATPTANMVICLQWLWAASFIVFGVVHGLLGYPVADRSVGGMADMLVVIFGGMALFPVFAMLADRHLHKENE